MVRFAFGMVDQRSVVFASMLCAAGLILLVAGWLGWIPAKRPKLLDRAAGSSGPLELAARVAFAIGFSVAAFVASGWPVLTLFGGLGGWFLPTLIRAKRQRRAAIERVDAIAAWVENLRDNISGSAGLQQALRMSGDQAPAPIRTEVRDLVLRLNHEPTERSLRRFAADIAHPAADMAVGCMLLATSRSAGNLGEVLAGASKAARDQAAMSRQIDAGRAATQTQAKMVSLVGGGIALYMIIGRPDFVAPYDTSTGQIVLFVICSIVAGSATALYRVARPTPPKRVFRGVEGPLEESDPDAAGLDDEAPVGAEDYVAGGV